MPTSPKNPNVHQPDSHAPTLGSFQLLEEKYEDRFGPIYLAEEKGSFYWLRVLSSFVTNDKNFAVRFDLCKNLPPKLQSPALISPYKIDKQDKFYYIATPRTSPHYPPQTLKNTPFPGPLLSESLPSLFSSTLASLEALEAIKLPFLSHSLLLSYPLLEDFYLCQNPSSQSAIKTSKSYHVKIAHFLEPFLFFGEDSLAKLRARYYKNNSQLKSPPSTDLFSHDFLSLPLSHERVDSLYTLGALLYTLVHKRPPQGLLKPLRQSLPLLDPLWDEILSTCMALNTPSENRKKTLKELLRSLDAKRLQPDKRLEKLKNLPTPQGMVLIYFSEKVHIGDNEGPSNQQPHCKLPLAPIFMDTCCVTNRDMQAFLPQYQPSTFSPSPEHPATNVSLNMAKAYCDYRSEQEKLPKGAYRLPTEFEWEACCRSGRSQQYPWGDTLPQSQVHAQQDNQAGAKTVKSHRPSPLGLYDMLGNVWEWTESRFMAHPYATHQDPRYNGKYYTIKGGCWQSLYSDLRASMRQAFPPNERKAFLGFRCVLDPKYKAP